MELGSSGERMRGEKDEEKVLSPMFPRLHVNDTEKGGPRAPPRNKMALYEQLTIPTQRFSSGSASATPLPSSTPAPLTSSSHVSFVDYCNYSLIRLFMNAYVLVFSVFQYRP